jgi:hypothetical protein
MTDKRQIPSREYSGVAQPDSEGQQRRRASDRLRNEVALAQAESSNEFNERRLSRTEAQISALTAAVHRLDVDVRSELASIHTVQGNILPLLQTLVTQKEFIPVQRIVYLMATSAVFGFIISWILRK